MPDCNTSPWALDRSVTFLNHGSFGACPHPVLQAQREWRERLEARPIEFMARELEANLDHARGHLADFLGAEEQDLVLVPNATYAVNSVLRSMPIEPGDQLLVTDHEYNACRNVLNFVAERAGAEVVVVDLPWPFSDPSELTECILAAVTSRTRLCLLDHMTSATAFRLPLEQIVPELRRRGVRTLVDGAHAPGQLELDLAQLQPDYYTGNCHKWLNAPKGAAFLYVARDLQQEVRPACISHGANSPRTDRSRFLIEFDWTGTADPTAVLCIPAAMDWMESQLQGGWPAIRARNRELVLAARSQIFARFSLEAPVPDSCIGHMAAIPLPPLEEAAPDNWDPLQVALRDQFRIEVPVSSWKLEPGQGALRTLRISAQLYNQADDYERLADALDNLGVFAAASH